MYRIWSTPTIVHTLVSLMSTCQSAPDDAAASLLDPRRLGFDVTVFASVHLSSQADADLRAFEEFVRAEPLVRE